MPSTTMPVIIEYLEIANCLEELDISWNNFRPRDFVMLMDHLQNNVILHSLNLSWNQLIPTEEQKLNSDFRYPNRIDKFFDREDHEFETLSALLANRFAKMVRFSTHLQHLDLTNTGLNEIFLFDILPGLRRSKSLLSFHCGVNPGINKKIQKYWH